MVEKFSSIKASASIYFSLNFKTCVINLIPAGVLENQDRLGGGGKFDSPPLSKSHVDVQI